jgi:hypothetical protein
MDHLIITGLVGVGMFLLGWFTHTWIAERAAAAAEAAGPPTSRWKCQGCGKVKELPSELDRRVLVCNNCNQRLVRLGAEATG